MSTAPVAIEQEETDESAEPLTAAEQDPLEGREDLQRALYRLAEKCYGQDKLARRQEVMDARQQRFYWRDVQYIYWSEGQACFMAAPQGQSQLLVGSTAIDMPRYTDVYNIYTAYGLSILAAFTQNPVSVRFLPEDPKDGQDLTAKTEAEKYRHYFDRSNDNKKLQQDIGRYYLTDGRTVTYTYFCEKRKRTVSECYGVLENKGPMHARNISECPYEIISYEVALVTAKEDYPDYASKIKPGAASLGESQYEKTARLGILQGGKTLYQSGDAYSHLVTKHLIWFRPSQFRDVSKAKGQGNDDTIAAELKNLFPDGCFVTFIGDVYCGSKAQSMDECLEISHPIPGDGMNRPSMLRPMVSFQDTTNDMANLWKETYDYCIPVTYMNCGPNDMAALREQQSEPGNHLPFKKPAGEPMGDQFYREEPAQVSGDFVQFLEDIRGPFAQFVSGALPALFGGNMDDQKTARGYGMARDQAMGRMGIPWGSMQRHFATVYRQAAYIEAEHREGETMNVEIPTDTKGGTKNDVLDFEGLRGGKVFCYPDADSAFPETYASKRAAFMQFIQMAGPAALQFISSGNNLQVLIEMLGVEEFELPGQEATEQQRREIAQLLDESPVPDEEAFAQAVIAHGAAAQAAVAAGQQPPEAPQQMLPAPTEDDPNNTVVNPAFAKSSIQPDPNGYDQDEFHWQECQRFVESVDGEDAKKNKSLGFHNVYLHGLEHKKRMEAAQAQQAMQALMAKAGAGAQPQAGAAA